MALECENLTEAVLGSLDLSVNPRMRQDTLSVEARCETPNAQEEGIQELQGVRLVHASIASLLPISLVVLFAVASAAYFVGTFTTCHCAGSRRCLRQFDIRRDAKRQFGKPGAAVRTARTTAGGCSFVIIAFAALLKIVTDINSGLLSDSCTILVQPAAERHGYTWDPSVGQKINGALTIAPAPVALRRVYMYYVFSYMGSAFETVFTVDKPPQLRCPSEDEVHDARVAAEADLDVKHSSSGPADFPGSQQVECPRDGSGYSVCSRDSALFKQLPKLPQDPTRLAGRLSCGPRIGAEPCDVQRGDLSVLFYPDEPVSYTMFADPRDNITQYAMTNDCMDLNALKAHDVRWGPTTACTGLMGFPQLRRSISQLTAAAKNNEEYERFTAVTPARLANNETMELITNPEDWPSSAEAFYFNRGNPCVSIAGIADGLFDTEYATQGMPPSTRQQRGTDSGYGVVSTLKVNTFYGKNNARAATGASFGCNARMAMPGGTARGLPSPRDLEADPTNIAWSLPFLGGQATNVWPMCPRDPKTGVVTGAANRTLHRFVTPFPGVVAPTPGINEVLISCPSAFTVVVKSIAGVGGLFVFHPFLRLALSWLRKRTRLPDAARRMNKVDVADDKLWRSSSAPQQDGGAGGGNGGHASGDADEGPGGSVRIAAAAAALKGSKGSTKADAAATGSRNASGSLARDPEAASAAVHKGLGLAAVQQMTKARLYSLRKRATADLPRANLVAGLILLLLEMLLWGMYTASVSMQLAGGFNGASLVQLLSSGTVVAFIGAGALFIAQVTCNVTLMWPTIHMLVTDPEVPQPKRIRRIAVTVVVVGVVVGLAYRGDSIMDDVGRMYAARSSMALAFVEQTLFSAANSLIVSIPMYTAIWWFSRHPLCEKACRRSRVRKLRRHTGRPTRSSAAGGAKSRHAGEDGSDGADSGDTDGSDVDDLLAAASDGGSLDDSDADAAEDRVDGGSVLKGDDGERALARARGPKRRGGRPPSQEQEGQGAGDAGAVAGAGSRARPQRRRRRRCGCLGACCDVDFCAEMCTDLCIHCGNVCGCRSRDDKRAPGWDGDGERTTEERGPSPRGRGGAATRSTRNPLGSAGGHVELAEK